MNCHKTAARLFALIALVIVLSAGFSSFATAKALFSTKAPTAILIDADSGAVLFAKNADKLFSPASMSKLMTLAILFRELKAGRVHLEDRFTASEHAWRTGGGPSGAISMYVPLDKEVSIDELIQGIVIRSGNDACIIVAEGLEGTEEAFAAEMVREARQIGLKKSTFGNSTGLDHPKQLMSVRELAQLAQYMLRQYPEYYHYFSQKDFRYRKRFTWKNTNSLIFKYGADGFKTGKNSKGEYGIVASKKVGDRRLIAVTNGMKSWKKAQGDMQRLLNWGLKGFREFKIFKPDVVVGYARIIGGSDSYMPLVGAPRLGAVAMLPRYLSHKKLKAKIEYQGPLIAPVRRGDKVASLVIRTSGRGENRIPLFAAKDVKRGGVVWRGIDTLLFQAFGWLF